MLLRWRLLISGLRRCSCNRCNCSILLNSLLLRNLINRGWLLGELLLLLRSHRTEHLRIQIVSGGTRHLHYLRHRSTREHLLLLLLLLLLNILLEFKLFFVRCFCCLRSDFALEDRLLSLLFLSFGHLHLKFPFHTRSDVVSRIHLFALGRCKV